MGIKRGERRAQHTGRRRIAGYLLRSIRTYYGLLRLISAYFGLLQACSAHARTRPRAATSTGHGWARAFRLGVLEMLAGCAEGREGR